MKKAEGDKVFRFFVFEKKEIGKWQGIYTAEVEEVDNAELKDFVEQVRERSDIFSVVSRYVQLELKGGRYWACCPFHGEKTASFTITPDKGLFYCFGCHAGGNVFKFLSMIENISYFDAVKLQAQRLGMSLPTKKSVQENQQERERKILLKINEQAKNFYRDCLNGAMGEVGRKYLESRGITKAAIESFQLGYAPDSWDSLTQELTGQGFTSEQLLSAGVVSARKSGGGVYDRMRGRVIIPIADTFGSTVGFGGRILNSEDEKNSPKYLNSPETILFNKRNLLFGLDKAHRAISAANCAIVVEGYMDAISLVSAGVENVVATLGTSFTAEHARLILRYARRVIFCYDSDAAGQKATMRALPIVREAGAEVFVITIPDGKDPDDFVRKHGKAAFEDLTKNASDLIAYRTNYILKNVEHTTPEGKLDALRKILPVVVDVKDKALQQEYRKKLATDLVLDEDLVMAEWRSFKAQPVKSIQTVVKDKGDSKVRRAGAVILRMAWHEPDLLDYVLLLVPKEMFLEVHRAIIDYLEKCFAEDKRPDDLSASAELSEAANAELSYILLVGMSEPRTDNELKAFEDSVKILRHEYLLNRYNKTLQEIENCMLSNNPAYVEKIQESLKIKMEMDEL